MQDVALARQLIRVGQAVGLGAQLLVLAGPNPGAVDLAELEADEVGPALEFPTPLFEGPCPPSQTCDPAEGVLHLRRQIAAPGEGVQHRPLKVPREQPLVLVLSMDVHQHRPDPAQDSRRHR